MGSWLAFLHRTSDFQEQITEVKWEMAVCKTDEQRPWQERVSQHHVTTGNREDWNKFTFCS